MSPKDLRSAFIWRAVCGAPSVIVKKRAQRFSNMLGFWALSSRSSWGCLRNTSRLYSLSEVTDGLRVGVYGEVLPVNFIGVLQ